MKVIVRRLISKHSTMHSMTQGMWRYPPCWETHTLVKAGTKRERFNFAMGFIMLLWLHHPAAIRSTVLENKRCNLYKVFISNLYTMT